MNTYNIIESLIALGVGTWCLMVFIKSRKDSKLLDRLNLPGLGNILKHRLTYLIGAIVCYIGALLKILIS